MPNQSITAAALTDQPFPAGTMADPVFLGERQSLTTAQRGFAGLWVFACYAKLQDSVVDTFVQRVQTFHACTSGGGGSSLDADPNGLIQARDLTAYTGDWAAAWPNADMDGDGDADADDYAIFITEYNSMVDGR